MDRQPGTGARISLTCVTEENAMALAQLRTADGQEGSVVPADGPQRYVRRYAAIALAESTLDVGSSLQAVVAGDSVVGLVWFDRRPRDGIIRIHRLLIDAPHQRRGYGTTVMELVLDQVRCMTGTRSVELLCLPAPRGPEEFFRRLGFGPTGDMTGEEILMRLPLRGDSGKDRVTLVPLTPAIARYVCNLEGSDYVAPNAWTLIQGHDDDRAWLRVIVVGGEPVGVVMLYDDPSEGEYFVWRLMLSPRHRGKGYGRETLRQVADYVKTVRGGTQLGASCGPGPGGPEGFYRRLGFSPTGDLTPDGKEIILRLIL